MAFDPSMYELFPDTITLEPFSSQTVTQVKTYGAAVSYRAQVSDEWSAVTGADGRTYNSKVSVIIPGRVHVDPRDRLTLPSGWVPNQPPILAIDPVGGVNSIALDNTTIRC